MSESELNFSECDRCGTTKKEQELIGGKCKVCYALQSGLGRTEEVPVALLERLIGMAQSRHPTTCHEDAYELEQVLKDEGLIPEDA